MSRSGFRPQLDALEARDVPAVSIYVLDGGETLKIVGSKASDEVRITQDDASNTLEIASGILPKIPGKELLDSSSYTFNSSRVKNIIVDLGIGNDAFYYSLAEDSDLLHAKTLTI
ncbi:MAG TPA: hypothetical protein PKA06_17010, partial [Gemmatales bacterium]|nr:hypothetical protein [Gemmatales bacterium]